MTRIKDITGTTTSAASDDYIALDGVTNNSRKILASDLVPPAGWQVIGTFVHGTDGSVANKSFTGIDAFSDLMLIGRGITTSVSADIIMRVSVDGGSSYYSASGDYVSLNSSAAEANSTAMAASALNSSAKSPVFQLFGNTGLNPPYCRSISTGVSRLFVASSSKINAVRIGAGSGNMTGGSYTLLGRV